ncbi:MAG: hypothetical protein WAM60_07775 [Candidatus Promineifilaceae bacterium]
MTTITADWFLGTPRPTLSPSARGSDDKYASQRKTADPASSIPSYASAQLARIAEECSQSGWDGYKAAPITKKTRDLTQSLLELLPPWIPAPEIAPEADGEIAVHWYFGPRRTFGISVNESGKLHYAGLFGDVEEIHGVSKLEESIPKNILRLLSDVLRNPV